MSDDSIKFDFGASAAPPPVTQRKPRTTTWEEQSITHSNVHAVQTEAAAKLAMFQQEKSAKTIMASAFATTIFSSLRREYLANSAIPTLRANLGENINENQILWMRLSCVGLETGFTLEKAAEALECLFSAFHKPGRERLLFLVSGDRETGRVTIRIGLQPVHGITNNVSSTVDVWNGFAKANWPGLSFEEDNNVSLGFSVNGYKNAKPGRRPGIRVLTGIPASRNKESIAATIDKLASALSGRTWSYLVIAEPIANDKIIEILQKCRELQGRAESLKSFQLGQNANTTTTEGTTTSHGGNESISARDPGDVAMSMLVGAALGGAASCMGIPPIPPFCAGFASALFASKTHTTGTNWSESLSHSLSEARGVTFSETVANKHAEGAAKLLEAHIGRLQLCEAIGAWSVGTYLIGENETTADIGANALKALLSGDDSHWEPIRITQPLRHDGQGDNVLPLVALERFNDPNFVPMESGTPIIHPFGELFGVMKTLLNTRELTRLANFPLSNIPGIPVRRISSELGIAPPKKNGFDFGISMYRGETLAASPYRLDPSSLAKHALVCGINGSGKTNTILGILGALLDDIGAPFLVIEPAKLEYVEWAVARNRALTKEIGTEKARKSPKWINIYIPGRERWDGESLEKLQINPFDFVWLNPNEPPKTLEHIDRLKTVINAAMPMQEVLPVLMEELIYMAYSVPRAPHKAGEPAPCWLPKNSSQRFPEFDEKVHLPSFQSLSVQLRHLFTSRTYAKDVQLNLRAALETRIDGFKRGWRKELLNRDNPRNSRADWEALFERPTVVNLTSLASDEDKAFFMAILLLFIYEYRQECSELPNAPQPASKAGKLRHLLVVEEAHRVLGRAEPASSFSAAPKQKVSEMFSNMISEVRAYGQGMLIADQIPCRLNEDAVKNTNLKIVHKLVSADDRAAMATALNLWEDQERIIGDLGVGEVLIRGDMDKQAVMVKVNKNV